MQKGARGATLAHDNTRRVHPAIPRAARQYALVGAAAVLCFSVSACSRSAAATPTAATAALFARPSVASQAVQGRYRDGLDTLARRLDEFAAVVDRPAAASAWPRESQQAFLAARDAFKRVETLFEFASGATAQELNGAAIPETEENDGVRVPMPPTGFQVVEEALFPQVSIEDSALVRHQVQLMQSLVIRARAFSRAGALTEMNLFDAVRLEIARVSVLALANADTPVAERGLREGSEALRGMRTLIEPLAAGARSQAPAAWAAWDSTLLVATSAVATADGATLDRLALTRITLVPLAHRWAALRVALGVALPPDGRPWRAGIASIFDSAAFDPWQFAPAYTRGTDTASAAALGATLFADTRLSGDGTRSCASCHDPALAFSDGRARSLARVAGVRLRNAPTLLNAALQRAQFADSRAAFLEDQVTDVVENTHELGGALTEYARRLRADPSVRVRFVRSFGEAGDSTVTPIRVAQALAAFERTLIALDAPFDRYVRGDSTAMTLPARRGYSVFMGKGKCGTCHFAPLFNGTVPPVFARSELEIIGTPAKRGWTAARLDGDSGRAHIYAAPGYLRAFKTPTLRNVARTAPYMHNGVYRTLDEVVEFYNRGGGAGLGLDVPNQTLPFDRLHLTGRDKQDLIAFMESLTDSKGGARRH